MVWIEDDTHAAYLGSFRTFAEAIAELHRLAEIPWDQDPNKAPCSSWQTCGRTYVVSGQDLDRVPSMHRSTSVLNVSAKGIVWVDDFEQRWEASAAPVPVPPTAQS